MFYAGGLEESEVQSQSLSQLSFSVLRREHPPFENSLCHNDPGGRHWRQRERVHPCSGR